jgi:subtilisin family serine protease
VPPRLLNRLAAVEDPTVASAAARTLRITTSLRAFRNQLSTGAPSPAAAKRTGLRRQVFNCQGFNDLPGDIVRSESDEPVADPAVNRAFDHAGTSWNFFNQVFKRESVDDHGRTLVSSVHYSQNYDNAFWNGNQMVYGDGDGKIFQNFTNSLEVIAHELTHGVTQFSAQLPYQNEQGALNESFSDVFGSLVKQWSLGQTADEADWLIGVGILAPGVKGRALRDMANPGTAFDDPVLGKDEQPGHMKDYVQTTDDDGGVHINSGIPNRAFVLAAKAIGGRAWDVTGKIWYVTLTERLTSSADFRKCAEQTISVARDLFADDPSIAQKVAEAWVSVGVIDAVPAELSRAVPVAAALAVGPAMAVPAIDQAIAGLGHAKVLIALKPETAGAAAAAAAPDLNAYAEAVRKDLEAFFVQPDEQQYASPAALAGLAVRAPGSRLAAASPEPRPRIRVFPRLGLAVGLVDYKGLGTLRAHQRVKAVHAAPTPSLIAPVSVTPAKASGQVTWGIKRLNIGALWGKGYDGKNVRVGHLDTGVDGSHPALAGAIADGDFAEFDFAANQVPGARPHDSGEHGTHTAGTVLGRAGPRGRFGVAPGAQLVSALSIEGGQVIDRILAGLEWIVSRNVHILSMSVGLPGAYVDAFEELIAGLRRNKVLPVIAIGNEGPDTSRSPGNYPNVLSVGACTEGDLVADFSSSQRMARPQDPLEPDLVAPGVNVLSCIPGGEFALMDGTSMATPHVAGLAALLRQAAPAATMDDIENAILGSCSLPTTMPNYRANRGVPDAAVALARLTGAEAGAWPAPAPIAASAHRSTKRRSGRKKVA